MLMGERVTLSLLFILNRHAIPYKVGKPNARNSWYPWIPYLLPPNQLEMPLLAFAAPSSTFSSNLLTDLMASARASLA